MDKIIKAYIDQSSNSDEVGGLLHVLQTPI